MAQRRQYCDKRWTTCTFRRFPLIHTRSSAATCVLFASRPPTPPPAPAARPHAVINCQGDLQTLRLTTGAALRGNTAQAGDGGAVYVQQALGELEADGGGSGLEGNTAGADGGVSGGLGWGHTGMTPGFTAALVTECDVESKFSILDNLSISGFQEVRGEGLPGYRVTG